MSTTTGRTRGHPCSNRRTAQAARPPRTARRRAIVSAGICAARLFAGLPTIAQRNGRVDESNRTPILVLVSGALWFGCGFGVGAAEAQDFESGAFRLAAGHQAAPVEPPYAKWEIFGGAGVVRTETALVTGQVGANVWMSRHWGAGISHLARHRVSLFSIRYRLRLYDGRTELHIGASPVQLWTHSGSFGFGTTPTFDFSVGRRIYRGFGGRFGLAVGCGEGGYVHPMGLAFWSFD